MALGQLTTQVGPLTPSMTWAMQKNCNAPFRRAWTASMEGSEVPLEPPLRRCVTCVHCSCAEPGGRGADSGEVALERAEHEGGTAQPTVHHSQAGTHGSLTPRRGIHHHPRRGQGNGLATQSTPQSLRPSQMQILTVVGPSTRQSWLRHHTDPAPHDVTCMDHRCWPGSRREWAVVRVRVRS